MDFDRILRIIEIALPFVIGLLIKSPIWKGIPKPVARVLAKLDAATIEALYEKVKNKDRRRETAIEVIRSEVYEYLKVDVPESTAGDIVDWLQSEYKRVVK